MTSHPDEVTTVEERPPASAEHPEQHTPAGGANPPGGPVLREDEARRRSIRPWAIAGGCAVLVAIVGAGLTSTPLFHAKTLTVQGERHLSERQVLRLAGVGEDTNVFRLDEASVRRRLLREPWIVDAKVSTALPSTLGIVVIERVPVAVAITEEGRLLVAADGVPLGVAPASTSLPDVRLLAEPGEPAPAFDAVAAGAEVAGAMTPELRSQVEAVAIALDGTLTLELANGVVVTYGTAEGADAKAQAIRAVLAYARDQGRDLVAIDVSAPAAPTARFAGTPVVTTPPVEEPQEPARTTSSPDPSPDPAESADLDPVEETVR